MEPYKLLSTNDNYIDPVTCITGMPKPLAKLCHTLSSAAIGIPYAFPAPQLTVTYTSFAP